MFNLSDSAWSAVGVVGAGVSAIGTGIFGRLASAARKAHDLEIKNIKDGFESKVVAATTEINRLDASLLKAWTKIDDLHDNAVRKAELKEYRAELKNDMKELGDRLEKMLKETIESVRREKKGEGA